MRDLSFSALCFLFKRKNLQLHLFHGFDKRMTHTALSPESSGTHDLLLSPDVISRQKNKQSVAADRDTEDVRECEEQEIKGGVAPALAVSVLSRKCAGQIGFWTTGGLSWTCVNIAIYQIDRSTRSTLVRHDQFIICLACQSQNSMACLNWPRFIETAGDINWMKNLSAETWIELSGKNKQKRGEKNQ